MTETLSGTLSNRVNHILTLSKIYEAGVGKGLGLL